jgi:DNA-binding NtrC family response regulator
MEKKIMIVDDSDEVRDTMEINMMDLYPEYEIITFPDGLTAESAYFSSKPYVKAILTDFKMPGKNGMELAMTVKKDDPNVKICLMTGDFHELKAKYHEYALYIDDVFEKGNDSILRIKEIFDKYLQKL